MPKFIKIEDLNNFKQRINVNHIVSYVQWDESCEICLITANSIFTKLKSDDIAHLIGE